MKKIDASSPTLCFRDNGYILSFKVDKPFKSRQMIAEFKDKGINELTVTVDKRRDMRSLKSNALLWEICTRIGDAINAPKEDVYRGAIRQTGNYYPLPIKSEAVDDFKRIWQGHGEGWFAEVMDDCKKPGYKYVFAYYGSSVYDTAQMTKVINILLQDAKDLGLEILSERERSLLNDITH